MKVEFVRTFAALAFCACAEAAAQAQSLPGSLSGRWTFTTDGATQVFSLDAIKVQPDNTFTANLTWWQTNPWCAISEQPIVGRRTEAGIEFDVPRKCNIQYMAELNRTPSGWVGKAWSSMRGFGLYLDLKAN